MKIQLCAGFLLVPLTLFASACGSSASPPPTATAENVPVAVSTLPVVTSSPVPARRFLAGLVTDIGRLHDRSFNDLAWAGIQADVRRYHIRARVLQSATEAEYVRNLRVLARAHAGLIVAVGASMAGAVYRVAGQFPAQKFALVDARPLATPTRQISVANVANLLFKEQDAGYVAGVLAGLMEKHRIGKATHNTIGYLGAFPIPQVVRYLAGYVAGANRVDPTIRVLGEYAGTYSDPAHGRTIGSDQIRRGADILFQVASETGTGYLQAAGARGRYAIGADTNQSYVGPQIVTSALKRVNVAVRDVVRDVQRGKFRPGDNVFGASNGGTGIARPASAVPPSIVAEVHRYSQEIARGAIVPPVSIPAR
ncbi:MAG TPA: BMP family ABC transporter substrate-binding protein [Chloroflexota bacterium]